MEHSAEIFSDLYKEHSRDIYIFLIRNLKNPEIAREILQDAFLNFIRVYKSRSLPGKEHTRAILFKAARNLMINHFNRHETRRVTLVDEYHETDTSFTASENPGPEELYIQKETRSHDLKTLKKLIEGLPEELRSVLLLRYNRKLKLEEIAVVMGKSVPTISRYIRKAETRLREAADQIGFKPD